MESENNHLLRQEPSNASTKFLHLVAGGGG